MRDNECVLGLVPAFLLAFICFTAVVLSTSDVFAADVGLKPTLGPQSSTAPPPPEAHSKNTTSRQFTALRSSTRPYFTATDKLTALESLQFALSQVADGSSYVWHRNHGQLSGIVQPTRSYFGRNGEVCRELIVFLSSSDRSRKTKTSACRMDNGIWRLDS
ncbi:MAG: hypothetical protein AAFV69_12225 [Pseudomonadota bacterium]